jgi:hypothetical protein
MPIKPVYIHVPNCTPEEVDAFRSLIGRRLAITDTPVDPASWKQAAGDSYPIVREVNPLPSNPAHGEGVLVVLGLLVGGEGDGGRGRQ